MASGWLGKDLDSLYSGRIGVSFFLLSAALMRSIREPSAKSESSVGDDCERKLCHHWTFSGLTMNQVGWATSISGSSTFFLFLIIDKMIPTIRATRMTAIVIATAIV